MEDKAVKSLSPVERLVLGYIYVVTRNTKTAQTQKTLDFWQANGIDTDNISPVLLTEEIQDALYKAGCIDQNGLTGLGATWAKHFGTERSLPNEMRMPKDLKKGLDGISIQQLNDIVKQGLITLAKKAENNNAAQTAFAAIAKRFEYLKQEDFALEY